MAAVRSAMAHIYQLRSELHRQHPRPYRQYYLPAVVLHRHFHHHRLGAVRQTSLAAERSKKAVRLDWRCQHLASVRQESRSAPESVAWPLECWQDSHPRQALPAETDRRATDWWGKVRRPLWDIRYDRRGVWRGISGRQAQIAVRRAPICPWT